MSKPKQIVSVRITKDANTILGKWKRKYGGLNKSETIERTDIELIHLETEKDKNLLKAAPFGSAGN